jgi:protein ImuB
MKVVAVDALASRRGLSPGQNLSDAKAQVPDLEAREIDRSHLAHLYSEFADWHSNASPFVAVLTDATPYGDLCLDITGVAHLFGGEEQMLETLVGRLAALGFTVSGAITDTIGGAWALAHFAPGRVVSSSDLSEALAPLPVAALRLHEDQIRALSALGLKHIGQLYGRDRRSLQARFGASLIARLDQALGEIEERLNPRIPIAEYYAERHFAEPIGLIDDVLMCAEDLAVQLAVRLEAEALGAQTFHLFLYLVDHKVVSLSINASRTTRDADHIARLFKHRAERLAGEYDPGFGIDLIRLGASSVSELQSSQAGSFGNVDGTADLEKLFDRITSRLGPLAIVRAKPVDTHIPERASRLEPVVARTSDPPVTPLPSEVQRPLRLLPEPEPITVLAEVPDGPPLNMQWRRIRYRFVKIAGPERIEAEWWRSYQRLQLVAPLRAEDAHNKRDGPVPVKPQALVANLPVFEPDAVVRDYYVAEDDAGRRFWIFRKGLYNEAAPPLWYLHGIFA